MAPAFDNWLLKLTIMLVLCPGYAISGITQNNFLKISPQTGLSCSSDAKTVIYASSAARCGMLCQSDPECISFSIQINSSIENKGICQLFATGLSKCQAPTDDTFAFYKIMNPATSGITTATASTSVTTSSTSPTVTVSPYFNENPPSPEAETSTPTVTTSSTSTTDLSITTVSETILSTTETILSSSTTAATTSANTSTAGTTTPSTTTDETSTLNPNWNYTYAQTGVQGSIDSPGIDQNQNYGNNWDLYWKIIAPTGNTILLNPYQLNIEGTGTICNNDYLQFLEGENNAVNLGTYCGQQAGKQIQTSNNSVLLHFHSDNDGVTGLGFKVMYYASAPSQNNNAFPTAQTFNFPTQQNNIPTAPSFPLG